MGKGKEKIEGSIEHRPLLTDPETWKVGDTGIYSAA